MKQLPAAPTPAPVAPRVDPAPPPPEGHGRVLVDVTDGPTQVDQVHMEAHAIDNATGRKSFKMVEAPVPLCPLSPCVATIPTGNIILGFPVIGSDSREVELVHVGPDPSVYRRTLSVYTDNTGGTRIMGIILTSVGAASAITGTALLPIGLKNDNNTMTWAGGITLGGGIAAIVFGILMIRADAPTYQPGSSIHFPLAPQP